MTSAGPAGRTGAPRTLRLDAGKVAAAVPVAILVAAGAAVAGVPSTPPAAPAVEVPAEAVLLPGGGSGQALDDDHGFERVPGGAGPVVPAPGSAAALPASSPRVRLDPSGIPERALVAYQEAERLLAAGDPGCRLDWALVAAIGRVESAHGTFGGNVLGTDGIARPGIVGIALDGTRGTARITDTDGGRYDGDGRFDRAVGPMQFIPGTWRAVGVDADGDGAREPQDVDDAAAAAGVYLCSGPGDLSTASDRYRAVHRYNRSDDYVRTVLAIADAYARGVRVVPASALPGSAGAEETAPRDRAAAGSAPASAAAPPRPTSTAPTARPAATPAPPPSTSATAAPSSPADVVQDVLGGVTTLVPAPAPPPPAPTAPPPTTVPSPVDTLVPGVTCLLEPVLGSLLPLCPTP